MTKSITDDLQKQIGGKLIELNNEKFLELMKSHSKDDLDKLRTSLISTRDFYKRVLSEEYREKHPDSLRYKEAQELVDKYNAKGKILKSVIDSK